MTTQLSQQCRVSAILPNGEPLLSRPVTREWAGTIARAWAFQGCTKITVSEYIAPPVAPVEATLSYDLASMEHSTIAVALGVSHRDALTHLNRGDVLSAPFWVGQLWDIDRAQRALDLINDETC